MPARITCWTSVFRSSYPAEEIVRANPSSNSLTSSLPELVLMANSHGVAMDTSSADVRSSTIFRTCTESLLGDSSVQSSACESSRYLIVSRTEAQVPRRAAHQNHIQRVLRQ